MKEITVREAQNIFDVSLMTYGNIENAFKLSVDNNITLNDGVRFADVLIYDENNDDSLIIKNEIKARGLIITTGSLSGTPEAVDNPDFADIFDDTFDETFE